LGAGTITTPAFTGQDIGKEFPFDGKSIKERKEPGQGKKRTKGREVFSEGSFGW
jgi:hypothetical protein